MKYESLNEKPISHCAFARRMFFHLAIAVVILVCTVVLSTALLHSLEKTNDAESWARAFHHSALYLGGFGLSETETVGTARGRLFHGLFALFAGVIFAAAVGVMLAPILHRVLHWLHWDKSKERDNGANCLLAKKPDRV